MNIPLTRSAGTRIPGLPVLVSILAALLSPAHAGALSGRIVDAAGKPVAGAAVSLDRSKAAAVTDVQGRFSLATVALTRALPSQPARAAAPVSMSFRQGGLDFVLPGGVYSLAGRDLSGSVQASVGMPDETLPAASFSGLAKATGSNAGAVWDDTLAVSKASYLTLRIVPAGGDMDVGDVILRAGFPGTASKFMGFDQFNFTVSGKPCLVVVPKKVRAGSPWIWRTYFWAHKPKFDSIMCANGYYLAFMDAPNLYGAPSAVTLMNAFHAELTGKYGFSKKTNLVGVSRGAFYAYNWGRGNIDKISTLYADGAGMDYVSWPCGCYGTGTGSAGDWTTLKNVFGFANDAVAKAYTGNPYQNMKPFAQAKVPIIHVYGEADDVAPPKENVLKANDSLKAQGWQMKLLAKPRTGHVHGLEASDGGLPGQLDTLVQFVLRNTTY